MKQKQGRPSKDIRELSTWYRRRRELQRLRENQYRTMSEVIPQKYDYKNIPRSNFKEIPSERSIEILNDIMDVIQDYYGITLDKLVLPGNYWHESVVRSHLFWFVRFYRRKSEFDQEPFRATDSFITSMFDRGHTASGYGEKTIDQMTDCYPKFKDSHEQLWDILESKLDKYELG